MKNNWNIPKGCKNYDDFALEEYKNFSAAHYNTVNSISAFFKHYLVLITIPVTLLYYLASKNVENNFDQNFIIGSLSLLVSLIGFFVSVYMINLRCDAILYARAVNGVRGYFLEREKLQHYNEAMFRTLPRNKNLPKYFEKEYFLAVVIVFALINSFFCYLSIQFNWNGLPRWLEPFSYGITVAMGYFILHIYSYSWLSNYRENKYLKSKIIGIDIDGVLNKHREQFCKILEDRTNKRVCPDDITRIPVHECKDLNLGVNDESQVFNYPKYWEEMPPAEDVASNIKAIKNKLGYKIHIFTNRSWPDFTHLDKDLRQEYNELWDKKDSCCKIKKITKNWLKEHNINYDKFTLEWNTSNKAITKYKDRYYFTKNKKYDVFVEDTPENALRLSSLCEIVFLINHPYNDTMELPTNVILVDDWKDIYHYMRDNL